LLTIFPLIENTLSTGAEVTGIAKNLLAIRLKTGNLVETDFQ